MWPLFLRLAYYTEKTSNNPPLRILGQQTNRERWRMGNDIPVSSPPGSRGDKVRRGGAGADWMICKHKQMMVSVLLGLQEINTIFICL